MHGLRKPHLKFVKHHDKVDSEHPIPPGSNPFGSDDESETKKAFKPPRKTSSEPNLAAPSSMTNPFDDDEETTASSSSYSLGFAARNRYKNDFRDSGGVENQSVQELENYSVYRAEETTKTVNGCLKIAEEMREDATKTLVTLHHQGEQIYRTHNVTVEIDHDLSRGEKLLGSLGGMFSRTWKPKKTRQIAGPVIARDSSPQRRTNHIEQREKLGLSSAPKGQTKTRAPLPEPTDAYQKVEVEKTKQDDALSGLSNILGELKVMAVDMGTEIERQTKALDHFQDDVDVLDIRMKGANQRGRHLLGK